MKRNGKKRYTIAAALLLTLLLSTGAAFAASGAGTTVYQNIKNLGDGFSFVNTISGNPSYGREESYAAVTTPGQAIKPIVLACDKIYGTINMNKVIEYATGLGYNVLGAINTDFFSSATGVPLGLVVENGVYKSSPEGHPSVCIGADGSVHILDYTAIKIFVVNQGKSGEVTSFENPSEGSPAEDIPEEPAEEPPASNAGQNLMVTHFNKYRVNSAGVYLFDSSFGSSTKTAGAGWFVRMKVLEGTMKTSGQLTLEVTDTFKTSEAQRIDPGYMFLTAGDASNMEDQYQKFAVGDIVTFDISCYDNPYLTDCMWATGGGDVLIKDGAITPSSGWDSAIAGKNPRSALGVKADGSVVYYVVDGRQSSYSNGLTLSQLAQELLNQGCVNAINFDGGGSTAMELKLPGQTTATTVNSPSDGSLRKVSTYILFVNEHLSDGIPKLLHIKQDGAIVYQGATLNLDYLATDCGTATVSAPADVTADVVNQYGSVEGNLFTAAWGEGKAEVSLASASTGATGSGSIHVVNYLSKISVYVNGKSVDQIWLKRGESVQLNPQATYQGESATTLLSSYVYTPSAGLTVTDEGFLSVGDDFYGTGTVSVACGGITKVIKVTAPGAFDDISGHWAEPYITDLAEKGIVTGNGDGTFGPDRNIKRGDFILMLYRAAGNPEASPLTGFDDVNADDYYATAIGWARSQGIAQGSGSGFGPQDSLTREQAFTFIYRYLKTKDQINDGNYSTLLQFSDYDQISEYARVATQSLVEKGIVGGSDGMISPAAPLTRGQMAKILDMAI